MKDCSDRCSFAELWQAQSFCRQKQEDGISSLAPFMCDRCGRWHVVSQRYLVHAKKKLKRERCVTDRELHEQIARTQGLSLDELQVMYDLSKIRIQGAGVEIIRPRLPKP